MLFRNWLELTKTHLQRAIGRQSVIAGWLTLMALVLATPINAAAASPPCTMASAKLLAEGGNQDWSAALDLLAFEQKDAYGNHQLHTIQPDGTGDVCLSCIARAGGPAVNRHKSEPTWHPSGRWIVVQVENDSNPLLWWR